MNARAADLFEPVHEAVHDALDRADKQWAANHPEDPVLSMLESWLHAEAPIEVGLEPVRCAFSAWVPVSAP